MPTTLNGTYWTLNEIADAIGKSVTAVRYQLIMQNDVLKVGATFLIPDNIARQFISNAEEKPLLLSRASTESGIPVERLRAIVKAGFPHMRKRDGRKCIRADELGRLREAYNKALNIEPWNSVATPRTILAILKLDRDRRHA